jgi:hypothetical protein
VHAVEASFILHKQQDKNTHGQSKRETNDVDSRKRPVLPEVSKSEFQIIPEHIFIFLLLPVLLPGKFITYSIKLLVTTPTKAS